jgi:hypothetical protein
MRAPSIDKRVNLVDFRRDLTRISTENWLSLMMVCGQAFVKLRACSFGWCLAQQTEGSAEGAEREVAEFVEDHEVGVLGPNWNASI